MISRFAPLPGTQGTLTESPVWDARRQALLWCDIPEGLIHELTLGSGARRVWQLPGPVGSFGLAQGEALVVACRHDIILLERDSGAQSVLARLPPDPRTRANDGKIGPDGAFWVGTMDDTPAKEPIGALYRVTPEGRVECRVEGLVTSNGLAWSADGRVLFHSDSRARKLDVYDFDPADGALRNGVRLREFEDETGRPDGAAMDVQGHYWSAGVSAGRLNVLTREGGLVQSLAAPVPAPTMPCFGGPDMKTLFLTSLRHGLSEAQLAAAPGAGGLFQAQAEVAGVPVGRFGG
ncbi:SMP-30/gluconolactonase/LRE family protein [Acidocella sp. MX-AZ02]|uniref:SMP-30/gluconolactonase/LRE family protein n=1 Tax=Acidocella sp. MX-AZ02 TaxID=1214225 RepID=UPI00028E9633|nr:SMP-30/gluconolactonase/LRE family protein [Acidocella sp. MX-AZ02]EKM98366.1 SMP-30/gluconolaconase/LRE domain-containing protein [Acidocella sp. MX-AZ02]